MSIIQNFCYFYVLSFLFLISCNSGDDPAPAPIPPSKLEATVISRNQIDLLWIDNSKNETKFIIERKTGSDDFNEIKTVSADVSSFSDSGLEENTTYSYRVLAINAAHDSGDYTNTATAKTFGLPQLSTNAVNTITASGAISGGTISENGGLTITASGLVWDTETNPIISLSTKTNEGTVTTSFTSTIAALDEGTKYYVRAYGTNSEGTGYGEELEFTTEVIVAPSVSTSSVSWAATAFSGGTVDDDGFGEITERGVCWSTSQNPTINDSHTNDGTGTGSFTSVIDGLVTSTTYYIRAYATNSAGTAYGDQITFNRPLLAIGDWHQGGVVAHLEEGTSYQTGFVITASNQGSGLWSEAGPLCTNLVLNDFDDWQLPSLSQLDIVWDYIDIIDATAIDNGGQALDRNLYWSSSSGDGVAFGNYCSGCVVETSGSVVAAVRAIRTF